MQGNIAGPPDRFPGWRLPLTAMAAGLLMSGAALADDLLVVGSTVPDLAPGDIAPTGASIEVPRDSALTLVSPSGGVLKIEGPWRGQIDLAGADEGPGLIQRLYALFQMPDRRARFGATRSLSRCVTVDLDQDDDICVAEPSCIVFQANGTAQEPVVMDGPDGAGIALAPAVGAGTWRWPGDLIRESGTYTVRAGQGRPSKKLEVHLQPELPTLAHEIAWMGESGCVRQAQEALAGLARN